MQQTAPVPSYVRRAAAGDRGGAGAGGGLTSQRDKAETETRVSTEKTHTHTHTHTDRPKSLQGGHNSRLGPRGPGQERGQASRAPQPRVL
eukprot:5284386-Pyramimonas_sp.AAC.1